MIFLITHKIRETSLTNVLKDVDNKEWRDQVIDALHIATGRVADGPDKQDPLKNLTHKHTHRDTESKEFQDKAYFIMHQGHRTI